MKDDNYLNYYEDSLAKQINSLGQSNKGIAALYINLDLSCTSGNQGFDVSYTYDDDKKENSVKKNYYKIEGYNKDNEDMTWYYDSINAGQGIWTMPYEDPSVNNLKMILSTKLYDTGYDFLLSDDYSFILDKSKTSEDNLSTMDNGEYKSVTDEMGTVNHQL